MRFLFPYSHAFDGGRLEIEDDGGIETRCPVEFSDGVVVLGEYASRGDHIRLVVPAYATARGTQVTSRIWHIARDRRGDWRSRRSS